MIKEPKGYALFDLDQTLLPWDMQLLYSNWVFKKYPLRRILIIPFLVCTPFVKFLGAELLKRLFLSILWGLSKDDITALKKTFVDHYIPDIFYPEIRALLDDHRNNGDLVILTSASPSLYVDAIGAHLGVHKTFCTRLEDNEFTPFFPKFIGGNNKHSTKIIHIHAWLKEQGLSTPPILQNSTTYTDSPADIPLIHIAEKSVLVNPSEKLVQYTKDLGRPYEVFRPERPFKTKSGKIIAALKMLFGIYPIS